MTIAAAVAAGVSSRSGHQKVLTMEQRAEWKKRDFKYDRMNRMISEKRFVPALAVISITAVLSSVPIQIFIPARKLRSDVMSFDYVSGL